MGWFEWNLTKNDELQQYYNNNNNYIFIIKNIKNININFIIRILYEKNNIYIYSLSLSFSFSIYNHYNFICSIYYYIIIIIIKASSLLERLEMTIYHRLNPEIL